VKEQLTLEACCVHHAWNQVWHILPGVVLMEVEDVHHCKQQGTGSIIDLDCSRNDPNLSMVALSCLDVQPCQSGS